MENSKPKKTWIITEYYYPIVTSTGYYITEIAEHLAKEGLDVNIICTSAKYNEVNKINSIKQETHNNVKINRILTTNIDKNNFLARGLRLFYYSLLLLIKTSINIKRHDHVICVTNPAFIIIFLPIIKYFIKFRYTIIVHDIFPENLAAIKKIKKDSIIYKCLKKLFDIGYSSADCCVSIGRDMSEVIKQKINNISRIVFIPNWSDNDKVVPIKKEQTKIYNNLKLGNNLTFQFAGNLGHAQGLDNILKGISKVDNENCHFLFIGGGAKYDAIDDYIKDAKSNNISLVGFQDRSTQNDFLNACDVAMITLNDGMYGLGVPSKAYNIMAAGKPILLIAEEGSEIGLCIKEYNLGWVIKPNEPDEFKEAIQEIYESRSTLDIIGNNAYQLACTKFSKEKILQDYYQTLK